MNNNKILKYKKPILAILFVSLAFNALVGAYIIKNIEIVIAILRPQLVLWGFAEPEEFVPPDIPDIYRENLLTMSAERNVRNVDDFEPWRKGLLNKAKELLKITDDLVTVNHVPSLIESKEFEEYIREKYVVEAYDGDEIIYYKLFPKRFESPLPGVLAVPGSGKGVVGVIGEHNDYQQNIGVELVKSGYIVYAIENRGWGMRSIDVGTLDRSSPKVLDGVLLLYGNKTLAHYYITDTLQILNYMKNDDDVGKIAVVGCSLGGGISYWITALDEDVDAVVIASGLYRKSELKIPASLSQFIVPGCLQYFDWPDIAATIAPRPMYISYGSLDIPCYRYEALNQISFTYIKRVYELLDAQENITFIVHNAITLTPPEYPETPGHTYHLPSLLDFLDRAIGEVS